MESSENKHECLLEERHNKVFAIDLVQLFPVLLDDANPKDITVVGLNHLWAASIPGKQIYI